MQAKRKTEVLESKKASSTDEEWEKLTAGVTFPPLIKVPTLITRDFLSSDSESEEMSAGDLASKIMKDLELSDSEEEKAVNKIETELSETETTAEEMETNQVTMQQESGDIDLLEKEIDRKIAEEEQAIKELEGELQKVKEKQELTCGGLNLDMPWKLIPVSDVSVPTGRQEWLNKLAQEREATKGNVKLHRNDPRIKLKCRKCKKLFISTRLCAQNGCPKPTK